MRSFIRVFAVMAVALLFAAGCSSNGDENKEMEKPETTTEPPETNEQTADMSGDLATGVESVLVSLQDLQKAVKAEPPDPEQIKTAGKALEGNWETIEKQVEEQYPDAYKNIEESLYPLIDEAKQNHQNLDKLQQLINDTREKLETFKGKTKSSQ